MKQSRTHHLVDFASRYSGIRINTLNAAAAIWRAESLVLDAAGLVDLKSDAEAKGIDFGIVRRATYEIIDYYVVGYVTCLEWHARSRLVDLMLFRPSCIQTGDVKKIADLALSQMVAEHVTVPHLLGAAANVSHIGEYLEIFKRVFNELGITEIIERELRSSKTEIDLYIEGADNSLYGVLDELFELRNRLVHEIGLSVVGHHSLRDVWEPARAVEFGKAVVAAMKLVEAKITELSPKEFPNRFDAEGVPENDIEKLKAQIASVEAELSGMVANWEGVEAAWKEAAKEGQEKELSFIEHAEFLRPVRHLDLSKEVQITYLRARLDYLNLLKSEASDWT